MALSDDGEDTTRRRGWSAMAWRSGGGGVDPRQRLTRPRPPTLHMAMPAAGGDRLLPALHAAAPRGRSPDARWRRQQRPRCEVGEGEEMP
jgi:hypothetical protein